MCANLAYLGRRNLQSGVPDAPLGRLSVAGTFKMVHPMHQCAAFPWQRPSKWCTTCTNRNCFLVEWRKNGAPDAPMCRVSVAETFKMVHRVHQSELFSREMAKEWCTRCTNVPRFCGTNLQNGAPRAPIGAVCRWNDGRMVHHIHQGTGYFAQEPSKRCITCTDRCRFSVRSCLLGALRAPWISRAPDWPSKCRKHDT
jgi:hypothetical protein